MKKSYKLTFSVKSPDEKGATFNELENLIKKEFLENQLDYEFSDYEFEELKDLKARNQEIVKLRKKGFTYQYIGDKFGLTRERVRKIIKDAGLVPNTPIEAKILSYEKSELITYKEISRLTGLTTNGLENLRGKGEFPEPVGKMSAVNLSGKSSLVNYWEKKMIFRWLEQRFEKVKDQLSQSINKSLKEYRLKPTHPKVRGMTNKLNFLSSKPFSEKHWVGHLTKYTIDWR